MTITVLLADDDPLARTGLRTLLSAHDGIGVIAEAADGSRVLPLVREQAPDVVLMDVRMPVMDGIEATRQLRRELSEPPKVVVITTFENDEYVYDALRAGASGFVLKRAPAARIAQAVRVVAEGDGLLFPEAIRALAAVRAAPPGNAHGPIALTAREAEVLRLVAAGLSNKEIADGLVVSLETVKTHVGSVLTKLGAGNRTQAVIIAYESGFVTPGNG
ncbi:MAG: response regulator [Stackebrandtia sp.]